MRIRHTAIIGILIAASLLLLSASAACSKVDHERVAEEVALEWTMTEVEFVSEDIAAVATRWYGRSMGLKVVGGLRPSTRRDTYEGSFSTVADADQIRDSLVWEIGSPVERADGLYEVTATASISFDVAPSKISEIYVRVPGLVSELTMPYGGTVDFKLEVDTTTREVIAAEMPLISVRLRQTPQGGVAN